MNHTKAKACIIALLIFTTDHGLANNETIVINEKGPEDPDPNGTMRGFFGMPDWTTVGCPFGICFDNYGWSDDPSWDDFEQCRAQEITEDWNSCLTDTGEMRSFCDETAADDAEWMCKTAGVYKGGARYDPKALCDMGPVYDTIIDSYVGNMPGAYPDHTCLSACVASWVTGVNPYIGGDGASGSIGVSFGLLKFDPKNGKVGGPSIGLKAKFGVTQADITDSSFTAICADIEREQVHECTETMRDDITNIGADVENTDCEGGHDKPDTQEYQYWPWAISVADAHGYELMVY